MPLSDTSALTTPSASEIDTPSSIMALSTEEFSLLLALGNCYDGNQSEVDFDLMQAASPTVVHGPASPCVEGIFTDVNNIYVDMNNVLDGNLNSDVAPDITNFDVYMNNDLQFAMVNESASNNSNSNPTAAANTSYNLLTSFQGPFTTTEGSFNTFSTDCRAGINNYPTTYNENCDAGFVAGIKNYDRRGSKDIDIIINDDGSICKARCNANQKNHNDHVEQVNDRNEQTGTQETLVVDAPSPTRTSRKRKASEELEITQDEKRAKFLERNRQAETEYILIASAAVSDNPGEFVSRTDTWLSMAKKIELHGLFATNKPRGMTCTQVLALINKAARAYAAATKIEMMRRKAIKLGHGGTLDPMASGVLVVGVNNGTKDLQRFFKCDKVYEATAMFGFQTDTLDADGQVTEVKPVYNGLQEKLQAILPKFVGVTKQIPPKYSALRMDGTRLYEYARKNVELPRPIEPRDVRIDRLELLDFTTHHNYKPPIQDHADAMLDTSTDASQYPIFKLRVECGGGTYIRSLIRDIAMELDTAAHLVDLVRTRQAEFILGENTTEFEDLAEFENICKAVNKRVD
ncbi:6197_t:CDS:2 [Paraglomus occultum]|uniref:tRNA pseudouridine(55) synthase n=1 Tax=Paraglomus occultum TaxID=144539 RepID=A0A9N8Z2E3_9GLOM|nr:6197_t:CDS:2 [Paraglomus occultum]